MPNNYKKINIGSIIYLDCIRGYWICTDIKPSKYRKMEDKYRYDIDFIGYLEQRMPPVNLVSNSLLFTVSKEPFQDAGFTETLYFKFTQDNEYFIHFKGDKVNGYYDRDFSIFGNLNPIEMAYMLNIIKNNEYYNDYTNSKKPYDKYGLVYSYEIYEKDVFIPLKYDKYANSYRGFRVYNNACTEIRTCSDAYLSTHKPIGSITCDSYITLRRLLKHGIATKIYDEIILK